MLKQVGSQIFPRHCFLITFRVRFFFSEKLDLPEELAYQDLKEKLQQIAAKNQSASSFLGDGLLDLEPSPVVESICAIRNLTTACTPYQPELSQEL